MYRFLTFILIVFGALNAKAQHPEILGSHISYRAIDTLTYEVKLTVIRECSGDLNALNDTLILKADSLEIKQKPTLISKKDITANGKNCPNKSVCAGGTLPYGFEERVYTDTFSLNGISVCDIYFIWTGNKRYSKMTNTAPSENHYNFAYLNYCVTKFNNSHVYTTTPEILTNPGQGLNMGIRLVDTIEINDSINTSISHILSDDTTKIKYIAPYSHSTFFTFLGFPYTNLRFPAGLYFDSILINFMSRPMKPGEITSYCVESNEFRKINGKTYKIGTTRWDMSLIIVKNPDNKTPDVRDPNGSYTFKLCTGNSTFVNLNSTDADTSDTTQIIMDYSGYNNITETYNNTKKLATTKIEWAAKPNEIRTILSPYIINTKVTDNACDIQGSNSMNIGFYINPGIDSSSFKIDKQITQCNEVKWIINRKKNYNAKKFIWYDFENKISHENMDTLTLKYKNKGWKKIALTIQSDAGCEMVFYDSVFLDSVPEFELLFISNDSVCKGEQHEFKVNILNGKSPFRIQWNDKNTDNGRIVKTDSTVFYKVKITDRDGCFMEDSLELIVLNPILKTKNISACPGDSLVLKAQILNQNNIKTIYTWNNNSISDSFEIRAKNDTIIHVKANFGNYCNLNDSLKIFINKAPDFNLKDSLFCNNYGLVRLDIKHPETVKKILWDNSIATDSFYVSGIPYSVNIQITDTFGCDFSTTKYIDTFPKTNLILHVPDSTCFNANPVILKAIPNGGSWKGNAISGSVFYPSVNVKGWQKLQYNFTDKNNCKDSAFKDLFVGYLAEPIIYVNPDTGKIPLDIYYNGDSLDNYDSYLWEFTNSKYAYKTSDNNNKIWITDTGHYDIKLTVTKNGCSNFTIMKNGILALPKNYSGIPNNDDIPCISIYPNPAKDELFMDFLLNFSGGEYYITDINGKEMLKGVLGQNTTVIPLKNIQQGIYLIEIKNESRPVFRKKFLKN